MGKESIQAQRYQKIEVEEAERDDPDSTVLADEGNLAWEAVKNAELADDTPDFDLPGSRNMLGLGIGHSCIRPEPC